MGLKEGRATPNDLVIRQHGWIFWIFGLALAVAGSFGAVEMGEMTTLSCERGEQGGTCYLVTENILGVKSEESFAVSELRGPQTMRRVRDSGTRYRVDLLVGDRVVPSSHAFIESRQEHDRRMSQVEAFVEDATKSSLTFSQDDRIIAIFMLLAALSAGGFIALLGKAGTCRFSVAENSFKLRTAGFGKTRIVACRLDEIKGARLEESPRGGRGDSNTPYRVVLELHDGREIPLTEKYQAYIGAKSAYTRVKSYLDARGRS